MTLVRKYRNQILKLSLAMVVFLLFFGAVTLLQAVPAAASAATSTYGAGINPTGDPIGGGSGYSNIVDPSTADYVVSTKSQLLSAMATATSGQIIYVADSAQIDLSGCHDLVVPAGVTIASGRGRNGSLGGLIYTNTQTYSWDQLFRPHSHVTFNGIRLRGPDGNIGTSDQKPMVTGIWCSGYVGLVVENCEIYNWTFAGVTVYCDGLGSNGLSSSDCAYIHHNSFHHNRRLGEGYGVSVGQASALIQANTFDYGRHYIEGERGTPTCNYIAEYNIFGPNCTHTMVDCHGGNDVSNASVPAGGTLIVRYNTFQTASQCCVKPRGVPTTICEVYGNWTYWAEKYSKSNAFRQEVNNLHLTPYVKMSVHDNWYGTTPPPGSDSGYTPTTPPTPPADTTNPPADTTNPPPLVPSVSTSNNAPAVPSRPSGTTAGVTNRAYTYWVVTTDPERDTLWYTIDWGDGSSSTSILKNSGTTGSASHSWAESGTYAVKVKATDCHGAVSAWSPALTVSIR
jgi:hypothetical protein